MRRAEGFSLIELLVVVALILIMAAITVPLLIRARMTANEAGGIAALRAISSGEAAYATTCGAGGYATDLADLVKPPAMSNNGFVSPDLMANGVQKSGYMFSLRKNAAVGTVAVLVPSCNAAVSPRASSYYCDAVPITPGLTGARYFASDTPGTIYVDTLLPIPNPIPVGTPSLQ